MSHLHYIQGHPDGQHCLVVVFLRGGADGLHMVVPVEDDGYYRQRPTIGVAKNDTLRLDSLFGFNPHLEALHPAYLDGDLAIVHAAGSEDDTRSHFEAQDFMEHGGNAAGGWLGRYLRAAPRVQGGPLSSIAIGKTQPESLRGAPAAVVMASLDTLSLGEHATGFMRDLAALYARAPEELGQAGGAMIAALRKTEALRATPYTPANGAVYPDDAFGKGMREAAQLIRARVGVEAVTLDLDGWDAHVAASAIMNPLMRTLGDTLAAFRQDVGVLMEQTTVVVMTEFGRRVYENVALGTDHGRGSVMLVLGGGVSGGQVHHAWHALEEGYLEGPGDLPVQTNYRDVLAAVFQRHSGLLAFDGVFPGHVTQPVALYE